MIVTNLKTKEKIYLYAIWGTFFLSCFYGYRNKKHYDWIQKETNEIFDYMIKRGYNIHWNIPNQTYEVIKEVRE